MPAVAARAISSWVSTEDLAYRLSPQEITAASPPDAAPEIVIDLTQTRQSILGLGSSLEHATCHNLSRLPSDEREKAMATIVDPSEGMGMNLMRICIGTPDFTASPWYTYDDVPLGKTDTELRHFSIDKDRDYVLPVLKLARQHNPELLFVASPWSPPAWMTTNDRIGGGNILPEHFRAYAEYLARFVMAYEAEGIPVHAITVQNEPAYSPETYPACYWTGAEQRDFIRDHLGPTFARYAIAAETWCWDHNFHLDFPRTILADTQAARYTHGVAFHHYGGKPDAMTILHEEHPDKDIHFTEGSTFGLTGASRIISYLGNWSRSYLAWVTVIDSNREPNPGPHSCAPTCIVLDADDLTLDYRFDFYMYSHFMKFVPRGAVVLASDSNTDDLDHIALRTPDGKVILVVVNRAEARRDLAIKCADNAFGIALLPKSIATCIWES